MMNPSPSLIERTFGTLKRSYGLARANYIGMAKVEGEFLLCSMLLPQKGSLFAILIGEVHPKSTELEFWKQKTLESPF